MIVRSEKMVGTDLVIEMVCRQCQRQINVRIYPVSGGNAEIAEYSCSRCGYRDRGRRPKAGEEGLYNVTSDWRR